MKKIEKGNAPDFWISYIRNHPNQKYADLDRTVEGKAVRSQLRTYLAQEQRNICGYCCSELSPNKIHNEHIKPESKYDRLTMDYGNIIASCTHNKHSDNFSCGMKKDNDYDEQLFVSPLSDDCADHFVFYPNGSIDSDTPQGTYTITLLGLHESQKLRASRKKQYDAVYTFCCNEAIDLCDGITTAAGEDYAAAKECYQLFFNDTIVPDYFKEKAGQLPAYIDMLEYFKEQGHFDFDSIVADLACEGVLQFSPE